MQELSLSLLDIAQNALAAGATHIAIAIQEDAENGLLYTGITDDGCGMSPQQLARATDPFYTTRTSRRVGLGLPLLQMACEMTGGSLDIESEPGRGTAVLARLGLEHIDRAPIGDIAATIALLMVCNPGVEFLYTHETRKGGFSAGTRTFSGLPDCPPLSSPGAAAYIRRYLGGQLDKIEGGRC